MGKNKICFPLNQPKCKCNENPYVQQNIIHFRRCNNLTGKFHFSHLLPSSIAAVFFFFFYNMKKAICCLSKKSICGFISSHVVSASALLKTSELWHGLFNHLPRKTLFKMWLRNAPVWVRAARPMTKLLFPSNRTEKQDRKPRVCVCV